MPRLSNRTTPAASKDGVHGTFSTPSYQIAPSYVPDSQYKYLERTDAYSPKYRRVSILTKSFSLFDHVKNLR